MYNFEEIIKKYNYDEEFSKLLYQIYSEIVSYYGNEEIVYNAFLNAEIRSVPSIYDYLSENDMLENDNTLITESELKKSTGLYTSKEIIEKRNHDFKISEIKRVVLIKDFDINDTEKKATLIHELCHMVKSYENEYVVKGNILVKNSGIIEQYYRLESENGKVRKKLIKEHGIGLEEGLTALAEVFITRKLFDEKYNQSTYGSVYALAENLTQIINGSLIKYAEMHHDRDILYEKVDNYEYLEKLADLAFKLNLEIYRSFDQEKIEEIKNIIFRLIEDYKELTNQNSIRKGKSK